MSYVTEYLELFNHVLQTLEARRGSVIHIESVITPRRGDYREEHCTSSQFSFVYHAVTLNQQGSTLMIIGNDGLFEIDCSRIDSLEIKGNDVIITEDLGSFWRHDLLRLERSLFTQPATLPN